MSENPYASPCVPPGASVRFGRWRKRLVLALVVSLVALFVTLPLMLTLLALVVGNAVAVVILVCFRRRGAAKLALLTVMLMLASLIFTDWGVSTPYPRIRVSWLTLIPACISQLALVLRPVWTSASHSGR